MAYRWDVMLAAMWKSISSVVIVIVAFTLSACGRSGSAQTGEALDETTEKPIEVAIVIAHGRLTNATL